MVSSKYILFFAAVSGLNEFRALSAHSGFTAPMMLFSLLHIQATRSGFSMAISLKNGIWIFDLLRAREGGPNSGEDWLRSCVSLINEGSQSCAELLPGVDRLAPRAWGI